MLPACPKNYFFILIPRIVPLLMQSARRAGGSSILRLVTSRAPYRSHMSGPMVQGGMAAETAPMSFAAYEGIRPFLSAKAVELMLSLQREHMHRINQLVQGTPLATANLYQIIERTHRDSSAALLHHLASQVWNTDFFLQGLTRQPREPLAALKSILERDFGSVQGMQEHFGDSALATTASGWTWLVRQPSGHLAVINTYNGGSPMYVNMRSPLDAVNSAAGSGPSTSSLSLLFASERTSLSAATTTTTSPPTPLTPVIGLSMWEHAYLTDYGIDRERYVSNFWKAVNWNRAAVILNLY